jgi:hypothetical protein
MAKLVRVSRSQQHSLPFKASTFYKMHHMGRFPEMFVKFGGGLFIDLDALEQLVEASRGKTISNTNKCYRKGGGN